MDERGEDAKAAPEVDSQVALRLVSYLVAVAMALEVVLVGLMYAIEIPTGDTPHFGPLSDIAGVCVGFLIVPVVIALRRVLTSTVGRALCWSLVAISLAGAISTALMIVEVVPFAVATGITVLGYLLQAGWLLAIANGWKSRPASRGLVRLARFIAWGVFGGAGLAAVSLIFGWGTLPQQVIMIIGIVPGVLAYAARPVWFVALARQIQPSSAIPPMVQLAS